ncbi:MAG: long-chain fatty acid--CoA ligase [Acidobacteriota bacterium]
MTSAVREIKTFPGKPTTLVEILQYAVEKYKHPNGFNHKQGGKWVSVSYQEIAQRARHIALGLYKLGVRHGDRVAILSESRVDWIAADLGILSTGAADVPLYSTLPAKQCTYILNDSGAQIVFASNEVQLKKLLEIAGELPQLKKIVMFDSYDTKLVKQPDLMMSLKQIEETGQALDREQPKLYEQLNAAIKPKDMATLIYTSGTTGEPKGVILTHWNITFNVINTCESAMEIGPEDISLSFLPFSHIFERAVLYTLIYRGVAMYLAESVDTVAANLVEVRPTMMTSVPRLFEKIMAKITEQGMTAGFPKANIVRWAVDVGRRWARLHHKKEAIPPLLQLQYELAQMLFYKKIYNEKLGGRVRYFLSGGAPLADDIAYFFLAAGIPILQGYGLSETSPVLSICAPQANRIGSVGKIVQNVDVRIADDGEILARGPNIMQGYFNKPQATAEVFEGEWFKTGDIGKIDQDGFLFITDRKKELLKTSGGKYLAPQPIESMLKGSMYIAQVMLIGDNRKFPSALIVPNWETLENYAKSNGISYSSRKDLCSNQQIIDMMQKEVTSRTPDLAQYEKIKKISIIENEFSIENGELTPTLKVKRRIIEQHYKDTIEKIYTE